MAAAALAGKPPALQPPSRQRGGIGRSLELLECRSHADSTLRTRPALAEASPEPRQHPGLLAC